MAAPERERAEERISMSELLASCAAADAVSTPPRTPDPEAVRHGADEDAERQAVERRRADRREAA
ncbi:hypothetical protein ACFYV5_16990 [Streptomyces sp. NPDC003035]|jgi:hypothetical protein|uniref:hypothetical protein n=1 Tax=unclassified Streptomyces TaxID=2593676 RepID=UPI0033AE40DA